VNEIKKDELLNQIDIIRLTLWRESVPYCKELEEKINQLENTILILKPSSNDALEYMKAIKLMHEDMDAKIKMLHGNFNVLCEGMQEAARDFSEAMKQLKDIPEMKQLEKDMRAFMEVIKKHFVKPAVFIEKSKPEPETKPEKKTSTGRHKHKPLGKTDDELLDAIKKAGGSIPKGARLAGIAPPSIYSRMRYNKVFNVKVREIQKELKYKSGSETTQAKPGLEPTVKAKQEIRTASFISTSELRKRIIDAAEKYEGCKEKIVEAVPVKMATLEIMLMRDKELKKIFDEYN